MAAAVGRPRAHEPGGGSDSGSPTRSSPSWRATDPNSRFFAFSAGLALLVIWVFMSSAAPTYACTQIFDPPATPAPSGSARLGVTQNDLGTSHITTGTATTYSLCPPASGRHYNAADLGPIRSALYGPEDTANPQGWIHNLEHGAIVILYKCEGSDACTETGQQNLRALLDTFPNSPVCNLPAGAGGSPIIARFESMARPYAALVWGRVMYLDTLDADRIKQFYATEGEQINVPELEVRCARPSPSPSVAPSGVPSAAPSGSAPASPAASASAPASSPASSTSPSRAASPAASGSPAASSNPG